MQKAFTLVELIIVVIIIGVLLSIGMTIYSKTQEKGRAAEARTILGYIRTAEENYRLDKDTYTTVLSELDVDGVSGDCVSQTINYFNYVINPANSTAFTITATRCTSGGKVPAKSGSAYSFTLDQNGILTPSESGY